MARRCYTNALKAMSPSTHYIEGLLVDSVSANVFEHAWLESNGVIVDPTLPLIERDGQQEWRYFDAFRWSYPQLERLLSEFGGSTSTPLQQYLPFWGKADETWLVATLGAQRHAAAVHEQRHGCPRVDAAKEPEFLRAVVGDYWMAKAESGSAVSALQPILSLDADRQ